MGLPVALVLTLFARAIAHRIVVPGSVRRPLVVRAVVSVHNISRYISPRLHVGNRHPFGLRGGGTKHEGDDMGDGEFGGGRAGEDANKLYVGMLIMLIFSEALAL